MSKLMVSPSSLEVIPKIIDQVDGIILGYQSLSVATNFEVDINTIKALRCKYPHKKIGIRLNKMFHNNDLNKVEQALIELDKIKVDRIFFYDLGVFNIAKRLKISIPLIIHQEHLNTSYLSNNFYLSKGVCGTYISDDITEEEVKELRDNYEGLIYKTIYGYLPIFYSVRYLVTNYMEYISKKKVGNTYYMEHEGDYYPLIEHDYGTIIYTKEPLNIISNKDKVTDIDYVVIDGLALSDEELIKTIKEYYSNTKEDGYQGFWQTKTIYKIKK